MPDARRTRGLAVLGVAGAGLGAVAVAALHVLTAGEVDPVRRTISEYALGGHRWLFDAGVLGLAAGSALVLLALVRAGLVRPASAGGVLLALWVLSLVVAVAFEKTDWSVGPSPGGYVHRYASLAAFASLPVAALAVGARWRREPLWRRPAAAACWLGACALLWLGTILLGVVLRPFTGVPWWRFVALGLVERGLAATEVAAVVVLGVWAWRAARGPVPAPPGAMIPA